MTNPDITQSSTPADAVLAAKIVETPDRWHVPALRTGETVNVTITGAQVGIVQDHTVQLRVTDSRGEPFWGWLPTDVPNVHILRTIPAEGVPVPGEVWADVEGREYWAKIYDSGGSGPWLLAATGDAISRWDTVHLGPAGPIHRVRLAKGRERK